VEFAAVWKLPLKFWRQFFIKKNSKKPPQCLKKPPQTRDGKNFKMYEFPAISKPR
jgi:hypothetical protein